MKTGAKFDVNGNLIVTSDSDPHDKDYTRAIDQYNKFFDSIENINAARPEGERGYLNNFLVAIDGKMSDLSPPASDPRLSTYDGADVYARDVEEKILKGLKYGLDNQVTLSGNEAELEKLVDYGLANLTDRDARRATVYKIHKMLMPEEGEDNDPAGFRLKGKGCL